MTSCPHCGNPVGEMAVICPTCRAALSPDGRRLDPETGRELFDDSAPDHGNYIVAGVVISIVGALFLIMAGTSDDGTGNADAWIVVGLIIGSIGSLVLLVGIIGLGVYIGMRQFHEWEESRSRE